MRSACFQKTKIFNNKISNLQPNETCLVRWGQVAMQTRNKCATFLLPRFSRIALRSLVFFTRVVLAHAWRCTFGWKFVLCAGIEKCCTLFCLEQKYQFNKQKFWKHCVKNSVEKLTLEWNWIKTTQNFFKRLIPFWCYLWVLNAEKNKN